MGFQSAVTRTCLAPEANLLAEVHDQKGLCQWILCTVDNSVSFSWQKQELLFFSV